MNNILVFLRTVTLDFWYYCRSVGYKPASTLNRVKVKEKHKGSQILTGQRVGLVATQF